MPLPRRILPGVTYLITRRCSERRHLLRPDPQVVWTCGYCLAEAANRFDVDLHAFCFVSNHYHVVATDTSAKLPDFMTRLDRHVALNINELRGRKENVFAPGSYHALVLSKRDGPLNQVVYTLLNPVAAALVPAVEEWPGLWSKVEDFGQSRKFRRPEFFFSATSTMPEEVSLTLRTPSWDGHPDLTVEEWQEMVREPLREKEECIRRRVREEGRSFLGRVAVLSVSPEDSPRRPSRQERQEGTDGTKARVAERDPARRRAALKAFWMFVAAYRKALRDFGRGIRDVVFPAGTYKMRVICGVACAHWEPGADLAAQPQGP